MLQKIKVKILKMFFPLECFVHGIRKKTPKKNGTIGYVSGQKNVIVSLTSFPDRISYIIPTLNTLLNQKYRPNMLILWLSKDQFAGLSIPNELRKLERFGLTIEFVDKDIKSYKKLIPALEKFPNDIIVTADDDLYYPNDWLSTLIDSYIKYPNEIHSQLVTKIAKKGNDFDLSIRNKSDVGKSSFSFKLLSGSGTLFPPNIFDSEIFDLDFVMNNLSTSDDIWYWGNAIKNNVKIRWIKNNMKRLYFVEGIQEDTPCLWNVNDRNDRLFFKHLNLVIRKFDLAKKICE